MTELVDAIARQKHLPRYLLHLFQKLRQNRLNLVTGAGISIDAGVPSWLGLLTRLAEHSPELKKDLVEHRDAGFNPEYLGQILFHRFRDRFAHAASPDTQRYEIDNGWAQSIHDAIYKDVKRIDEVLTHHPFLRELQSLARKVSLVINFNFDDILADAIGSQIDAGAVGNSLSVVWNPPLLDRKDSTTVYHVNGLLPRVGLKKRSPQLVFTEDSFADALARSPGTNAEYLFLRFVQNTMILFGLSLSDSSLKNYLRRNRDKSPANHHYMVHWIPDGDALTDNKMKDIFDANLELYNLITIFLTSKEINEFISILNKDERDFRDMIEACCEDGRSTYYYYIVGPVAAGKSTLLEHLRCFNTHEEWTRPVPPLMYKKFSDLTTDEAEKVDRFVYSELREKNRRMTQEVAGFHFMDRAPLDLYAFSSTDDERRQKTQEISRLVIKDTPLQRGEIIYIYADGTTLVKRNLQRGRPPAESGKADYLEKQAQDLDNIYQARTRIKTDNYTSDEIAKVIARHVLFDDYNPTDFAAIMDKYKSVSS